MAQPSKDEIQVVLEAVKNIPALEAELARRQQYKIRRFFPAEGPYRRELYPKFLSFFRAGAVHRERAIIAGNRVGKSQTLLYEIVTHATGEYPDWWEGRRFTGPVNVWLAGKTSTTTKDILQVGLLGPDGQFGSGMIPGRHIHHVQMKAGATSGTAGTIWVRHVSGGLSCIQLKSYDQGRGAFEGTSQHIVACDEEPPLDVYTEMLLRTMATGQQGDPGAFTGGMLMMTFTPLEGMSKVVLRFLPNGSFPPDGIVRDDRTEIDDAVGVR